MPSTTVDAAATLEWYDARTNVLTKRREFAVVRVVHVEGVKAISLCEHGKDCASHHFPIDGKLTVHSKFTHAGKLAITHHRSNVRLFVSKAAPEGIEELLARMAATKNHKSTRRRPVAAGRSGAATTSNRGHAQKTPAPASNSLPPLTSEQAAVVDLVLKHRRSVFFTGSAGTGKSLVLKHLVHRAPPGTAVTASTALAACAIGGTTLHAFAGVSAAAADTGAWGEEVRRIARSADVTRRWRTTRLLIIDEVSMVPAALFDGLELVARRIRGNDKPFGGMQLVLCGDFFQLPPVCRPPAARAFAFEAKAWQRCVTKCVQLQRVFRQGSDAEFVAILNAVRHGILTDDARATLNRRCASAAQFDDDILPTVLSTHRDDVDDTNRQQLDQLPGRRHAFPAVDRTYVKAVVRINASCPAKQSLALKVGAQVVLTRSVSPEDGLINGAKGVVKAFTGVSGHPLVQFANGKAVVIRPVEWLVKGGGGQLLASRTQLPLALAWAISIHKSQGMTLDRAVVTLDRCFEAGQAYVALSRVRALDGLVLRSPITASVVQAHPKVLAFAATWS